MEKVIPGTLREIDRLIPDALRLAFGIHRRASATPLAGQHDVVTAFAAALLPPRAGDPMDCDDDDIIVAAPRGGLRMVIQSCYLRDHAEDAHFAHAGTNVIGVADGVGGYRKKGVDASAFARGLIHNAFSEVVAAAPGAHVCPRTLLDRAYRKTVASRTPATSTAVILSLSGRTLRWAYVGDSGFAVFRDGMLLRRSQVQQHYFTVAELGFGDRVFPSQRRESSSQHKFK